MGEARERYREKVGEFRSQNPEEYSPILTQKYKKFIKDMLVSRAKYYFHPMFMSKNKIKPTDDIVVIDG